MENTTRSNIQTIKLECGVNVEVNTDYKVSKETAEEIERYKELSNAFGALSDVVSKYHPEILDTPPYDEWLGKYNEVIENVFLDAITNSIWDCLSSNTTSEVGVI